LSVRASPILDSLHADSTGGGEVFAGGDTKGESDMTISLEKAEEIAQSYTAAWNTGSPLAVASFLR